MMDPDKKVDEFNEKNSNLYQSSQHPKHFENEGGEYIQADPNPRADKEFGENIEGNKKMLPVKKPKALEKHTK